MSARRPTARRRLRWCLLAGRPAGHRRLVPDGVEGSIVGKALYAKAFTLEEALEAVSHDLTPVRRVSDPGGPGRRT